MCWVAIRQAKDEQTFDRLFHIRTRTVLGQTALNDYNTYLWTLSYRVKAQKVNRSTTWNAHFRQHNLVSSNTIAYSRKGCLAVVKTDLDITVDSILSGFIKPKIIVSFVLVF